MNKIKETIQNKKSKIVAVVSMVCMIMAMGCVTAFAEGTGGSGSTFPITSEMLSGVTDSFNSAITVAAPIGIGIMAIILGVNFVPKLIKKIGH